jgi:hypothetical protein
LQFEASLGYLEKTLHKNRSGGVAQGEDPEFKPQYHKKEIKSNPPPQNLVAFSTLTMSASITLSSSRLFSSIPNETRTHSTLAPHSPLLQHLATRSLLLVFIDLPVLEISHKWSHTACGLLCLASFTQYYLSAFINVEVWITTSFLLV